MGTLTKTMADGPQISEDFKGKMKGILTELCKGKIGDSAFADVDAAKICDEISQEALDKLLAEEELKDYLLFVKTTVAQINGFNQCANTYWTPGLTSFSVNHRNDKQCSVIL